MTEATCLVAINPPYGERKIGSVGIPFPYTDVRDPGLRRRGRRAAGMRRRRGRRDLREEPRASRRAIYTEPARTAGVAEAATCAPATSAGSTPTATSGSPAAPRT